MHSSQVSKRLNVDSHLKYVFIKDASHASIGGLDNITDHMWKPQQTYAILDLEVECVWDTLKPLFVNDIVKAHSDRVKEQLLLTLNGAFSILANIFFYLTSSFALRNFRIFPLSSPRIDSQMAVVFTWYWPSTGLTSGTPKCLSGLITSIPLPVLIVS